MQRRDPAHLSRRAQLKLDEAASSPLVSARARTTANQARLVFASSLSRTRGLTGSFLCCQWSEDNTGGIVNAGLAENSLMHDWLTTLWERKGSLKIERTDLTYGTSILGSHRLLRALAAYYSTYFKPASPGEPQHIATSNGLSSMIEHLAAVISDAEDAWLLPTPWYYSFVRDLGAVSQVRIASVAIPTGQNGTLAEVEAMDAEMERRRRSGVQQKVTAILVTNPHNPLGFCYPRHVLVAYAKLAEKWGLYLVSDEIYANSVFGGVDFVSILSIDVLREASCNPSRIVALYGMSKDFGANGFRAGSLVCQHNDRIMSALAAGAMPMRMGSPTDILWSALLTSPDLATYLDKNRQKLLRAYTYVTAWLDVHGIPYTPANAGHFVLVDFRAFVGQTARGSDAAGFRGNSGNQKRMAEEREGNSMCRYRDELDFLNLLVNGGVYLSSGMSYACPEPGFFRITFSIPRKELEVALERIELVCGLANKAAALSKVYPQ
ncbi:hypothetical protein NBRC10512_000333 [Rhodotorula toruloides]|uniref:RHTO0S26e01750g1_1 n=2 Tax=Rhodotorula toruloides TaxID=5286 RepID=A0A061BJ60_RHOTO|nr:1-aminocyclopropane-1-carboxylate synthase [Rhodotorula toruloides NP11]EMS21285.1 1-aminocyclopropane-1-carboxylate synthase [Rhodotorula toruloides NP11]CDR49437.1 RHTO0S26e01750g1_1 [Rhodotorula toruloides]